MQDFIVLGIIPGTSVQLTFNFWLYVGIALICMPVLRALWRRKGMVRSYVIAYYVARTIDQYQYRVPA
jgi:hypothetical protein